MTNLSAEFVEWCKTNAVGDEGEKATEWWRQRALQLAAQNDPENDCTDFAHPAWWRGYDCATDMFIHEVNDILDGSGELHGTHNEPWESLRQRLARTVRLLSMADYVMRTIEASLVPKMCAGVRAKYKELRGTK